MSWWMKLIVGLVIAIAGYTFYAGMWSGGDVKRAARKTVGSAKSKANRIAGVQSLKGGSVGDAKKCRENLRRLESIKRDLADQQGRNYGSVSWEEVRARFPKGKVPTCPDGGEYTLGEVGTVCRCSVGNNGTPNTTDDHTIAGF